MRKVLGTVLAAALLLAPGLGSAEILKNLKVGGQLDLQTISARNVRDFDSYQNDRIGTAVTRVLLNADWDLLDDVHATVSLRKNDRAWGSAGAGGQGAGGSQAIDAAGVLGNTYVQQAKVKIDKVFGHVDTTFGRQYYGDPDDLVIYYGPVDAYGLSVFAVDAFVANYSNDMVDVVGMAGKLADTGWATPPVTGASADQDVQGFEAWVKGLPLKTAIYGYHRLQHNNDGVAGTNQALNDNLYVYGLKLRGEAAGAWFQLDAAMNGGKNSVLNNAINHERNYNGKAFLAKAGYKADMPGTGALTPWVNFGWGSGEYDSGPDNNRTNTFQSISCGYRPGIINRRFDGTASLLGLSHDGQNLGTCGLSNRVVYGGGIKFAPAAVEKLTVGAEYWDYSLQRIDLASSQQNFNQAGSAVGAKHIGFEWGLTAQWKHSENVMFDAGYAGFQPGGFIKNQNYAPGNTRAMPADPVRMMFGDVSVKF